MIIVTIEQILEIHAVAIKETGGSYGLRDLGRVEAVIASQTQSVFGEDLYPSLHEKAAAIIRGIISGHPFVDGNKRTAVLGGLTFLRLNNLVFKAQKGELEDFAVKIAVENLDIKEIALWLKERT